MRSDYCTPALIVTISLAAPVLGEQPLASAQAARRTPVVEAFQKTRDAVVNIAATQVVERTVPFSPFHDFFDLPWSGRKERYTRIGLGSGFVIHPDGYVVTNAHVVADAADEKVVFADKSEYQAKPIAVDEQHDLAILKIESKKRFPALTLGRSHDLMIGETVIAIGNALGYQHTVTAGIISATDRKLQVKEDLVYEGLIQTDTSINPGNSGGPLLNILGELIGVNTAIRGDAQNIGFAIPVDTLRKALPELLSVEHHRRLQVGLRLNWQRPGLVAEATGPAAAAGLEAGDELLSVDGQPIKQEADFYVHLLKIDPKHTLQIEYRRKGTRLTARIQPKAIPIPDGKELLSRKFGLTVRLLTDDEAKQLDIGGGLYITNVEKGSPADRAGVQRGMVVIQIDKYFPSDFEKVGAILEQVKRGDQVMFRFYAVQRSRIDVLGGYLVSR